MKSFNFWRIWICSMGLILVLMGLVIAFLNQSDLFKALLGDTINKTFWENGQVDGSMILFQQWIYGVLGATCAALGVLVLFLTIYPFKSREQWSWICMIVAITVWFLPDTFLSFYFGVVINAVVNIAIYILILMPLLFVRKNFIVQ